MSGELFDAPNQQAVRPDASAPWEEGDGGSAPIGSTDPQAVTEAGTLPDDLNDWTKDELLAEARRLGVTPANASTSKAELVDGIAEARG